MLATDLRPDIRPRTGTITGTGPRPQVQMNPYLVKRRMVRTFPESRSRTIERRTIGNAVPFALFCPGANEGRKACKYLSPTAPKSRSRGPRKGESSKN